MSKDNFDDIADVLLGDRDTDNDGVLNFNDCQPSNPERQDRYVVIARKSGQSWDWVSDFFDSKDAAKRYAKKVRKSTSKYHRVRHVTVEKAKSLVPKSKRNW